MAKIARLARPNKDTGQTMQSDSKTIACEMAAHWAITLDVS